jgi:hypothetical protein
MFSIAEGSRSIKDILSMSPPARPYTGKTAGVVRAKATEQTRR